MKVIRNNIYLLKMIYASDKKRIAYMIFLSLNTTLYNVMGIFFMKGALDCVTIYQSFQYLVMFVLVYAIITAASSYFTGLFEWIKCPVSDSIIKKHITKNLYAKSLEVDLSELDNPDFYDKFNRAISEAGQRPFAMISTIQGFLTSVFTIFTVSTIIMLLEWRLNVYSLRNEIAVVYQDFQSFAFTVGENVLTRELRGKEDEQSAWEALKGSGLSDKIKSLPDKLQTPLTNEFEENGTNFSGGENQKLAIAKAIHQDVGVIIMDEPSSSLDPLSEHEMYLRMFEMCKDKTLILISHQLYCTKMVDKIYYMEDGSILESGSHEELMKLNGRYASLYNIQAEQYR